MHKRCGCCGDSRRTAAGPCNPPTADRIERHRGHGAVHARAAALRAQANRAESPGPSARARDWLASAKGEVTEERAFRLLGLAWAEADMDTLKTAARELLALQRSDGGWSQEPSLESDCVRDG